MSNDLLFSVIPRNRVVPPKKEDKVAKVKKDQASGSIDNEDKDAKQQKKQAEHDAHIKGLFIDEEI
jgi:hypothetical protein